MLSSSSPPPQFASLFWPLFVSAREKVTLFLICGEALGKTNSFRFSTYHRRKNMEVVHRRNLIERLDKLKASHEAFFTVPQVIRRDSIFWIEFFKLKAVSNNQLSLFLRRLLKSADIKQHISTELLERILLIEESNENSSDTAKMAFRTEGELGQFADRLTYFGKSETHLNLNQQTDEEDELTDEVSPSPKNTSEKRKVGGGKSNEFWY